MGRRGTGKAAYPADHRQFPGRLGRARHRPAAHQAAAGR